MPLTLEKKVDLLWDKLAISDLMNAFGRALDCHDWDLYTSCLHQSLHVDFQQLTGLDPVSTTPQRWTEFAASALGPLVVHHQYSNQAITVSGDNATAIVYMVARHTDSEDGKWNTQYGWYENDFIRGEGDFGWKICGITHKFRWLAGEPELIDMSRPATQRALHAVFGNSAA